MKRRYEYQPYDTIEQQIAQERYVDPIDVEVVAEHGCRKCGSSNVYADGRQTRNSYRVFAICRDCGHREEF